MIAAALQEENAQNALALPPPCVKHKNQIANVPKSGSKESKHVRPKALKAKGP
jgi:hypothetical protein